MTVERVRKKRELVEWRVGPQMEMRREVIPGVIEVSSLKILGGGADEICELVQTRHEYGTRFVVLLGGEFMHLGNWWWLYSQVIGPDKVFPRLTGVGRTQSLVDRIQHIMSGFDPSNLLPYEQLMTKVEIGLEKMGQRTDVSDEEVASFLTDLCQPSEEIVVGAK